MTRPASPFAISYRSLNVFAGPVTSSQRARWMKQGLRRTSLGTLMRHVLVTDGCWLWTGARDAWGYGKVRMSIRGKPKRDLKAPRAMYSLLYGDPGSQMVLHHCDNPPCVRPDHLFLGTHQDNMDDMARKGRRRGNIRLTSEQVLEIRGTSGIGARRIGQRYGIGPSQVTRIRNGEAWRDVS